MRNPRTGEALALACVLTCAVATAQEVPNWAAPPLWSPPSPATAADGAELSKTGVPTPALPFVGITPCRLVDTRPSQGFPPAWGPPALVANATRDFDLNSAPHCSGVPANAEAYSLNVTVTETLGAGDIRLWPAGTAPLAVSTQNWPAAGVTLANAAIVPAGTGGSITVQVAGSDTHVIIDINGYYAGSVQARILGTCPDGSSIRVVNPDGSVECETDDVGAAAAWSLTGNAGTSPGTNFLGTSDNQALEIKVNAARALRLEPTAAGSNVIGGFALNTVTAGATGATISGGGAAGLANRVTDDYGTAAGGHNNQAGDSAGTLADKLGATVGGGVNNTSSGLHSTVGGGTANLASGDASTIGGGGGAVGNIASGPNCTVGGGGSNIATGLSATVAGGFDNTAGTSDAFVGGGTQNNAATFRSVIVGGAQNTITDEYGTIGGGRANQAGDGAGTPVDATYGTVAGGELNRAEGGHAAVGGGQMNLAHGVGAAIAGGANNFASGNFATIPGGFQNAATGANSFAAGRQAQAMHPGAFVWGGSAITDFTSTGPNQFLVRAPGGVWFGATDLPNFPAGVFLNTSTGAHLTTAGIWTNNSDRAAKENYEPFDRGQLLGKLAALPITRWNYKVEGTAVEHIGPTAQDFHAAFGLGNSDRSIGTIDADGVALAAIQGLYEQVQEKERKIRELEKRLETLEARAQRDNQTP